MWYIASRKELAIIGSMEKKKNIIHINGKDRYAIMIETQRFVDAFKSRQDENSIDIYRIEDIRDWREITQNMQTLWLFIEKRLFVFSGSLKAETTKTGEVWKSAKKKSEAENILLWICENANDDTFIIFSGVEFDTKSSLHLWLSENADNRLYNDIWDRVTWGKRYPHLAEEDIQSILQSYKRAVSEETNESEVSSLIGQSFEKLSLIQESRNITASDKEESLSLETSWKIYDFSDAILRCDPIRALDIFHRLLESMNIHAFLASFIWLIRPSIYVKKYQSLGKTQKEISAISAIHPYVIQKSYESKITYTDLFNFYDKVISLNMAYRSGKWRKNPELWRIFDIELAIMGLKK